MQTPPNFQKRTPPPAGFRSEFLPSGSSQGMRMTPVTQQPMTSRQFPVGFGMSSSPSCPFGLECLINVDQLLVHQEVELLEVLTGFETKNKYTVYNNWNQRVFYAVEESSCCTRNCCGKNRCFGMQILDNSGREIIHLERPLRCSSCWCPCCLQEMQVFAPPNNFIGKIEQNWSVCSPSFSMKNASRDTVLQISGPIFTCGLYRDVDFKVLSSDGKRVVGRISKKWSGLVKEIFTDTDNFGISFPVDLDVRMKAVTLGACFLIDYMFFEKTGHGETDSPGMF